MQLFKLVSGYLPNREIEGKSPTDPAGAGLHISSYEKECNTVRVNMTYAFFNYLTIHLQERFEHSTFITLRKMRFNQTTNQRRTTWALLLESLNLTTSTLIKLSNILVKWCNLEKENLTRRKKHKHYEKLKGFALQLEL